MITKKIIKGRLGKEYTKMYIHVNPKKRTVLFVRYALISDLTLFPDWVIKRKFGEKYLVNQNCGFSLYTMERVYDIIDLTLETYSNSKRN